MSTRYRDSEKHIALYLLSRLIHVKHQRPSENTVRVRQKALHNAILSNSPDACSTLP